MSLVIAVVEKLAAEVLVVEPLARDPPDDMNADETFTEAPPKRTFDAAMIEVTVANDNRMATACGLSF